MKHDDSKVAIWDEPDVWVWRFNIKRLQLKRYMKYIICRLFHTENYGWIVDNQLYVECYCNVCHRMWEKKRKNRKSTGRTRKDE